MIRVVHGNVTLPQSSASPVVTRPVVTTAYEDDDVSPDVVGPDGLSVLGTLALRTGITSYTFVGRTSPIAGSNDVTLPQHSALGENRRVTLRNITSLSTSRRVGGSTDVNVASRL